VVLSINNILKNNTLNFDLFSTSAIYLWFINTRIYLFSMYSFEKYIMIKFLTIISVLCILTSCNSIDGYVKRSANDQTFDSKGFNAKKRSPMYNKKYIRRAERNVEEQNFDQEHKVSSNDYYEPGELRSYHQSNRKMYNDMMQMNRSKRVIENQKYHYKNNSSNLRDFNQDKKDTSVENSLKNEIKSMKKILEQTQKTIATYKCAVNQNAYEPKKTKEIRVTDAESKNVTTIKSTSNQHHNQSLLPSTSKNSCTYNEDLQITECKN